MLSWRSTGQTVEVPGSVDRVPEFDARSGDHLWSIITMYRWTPGVETPMLDQENLLSIVGPCCFYCEREYSPALANRRCKGTG